MKSLFIFLFVALAQGIGSLALGAALGTNAFDPGVPLGINEMNSIRNAASNSLTAFRTHITPANYQLMGFDSTNEVLTATNGEPLLIFAVRMSQFTNYLSGSEFNSLLAPTPRPRVIVPVMVGTNVRSATTLRPAPGAAATPMGWVGGDWGHPKLIRNLTGTYRAITNTEVHPSTVPFAVEIPMPRIWLVGYYDRQTNLVLRSTIDLRLGPIVINRNQVVTQPAMQLLATEARRYNPNLPN